MKKIIFAALFWSQFVGASETTYAYQVVKTKTVKELLQLGAERQRAEELVRTCHFERILKKIPYHCFSLKLSNPSAHPNIIHLERECLLSAQTHPESFIAEKQVLLPARCRELAKSQHDLYLYKAGIYSSGTDIDN